MKETVASRCCSVLSLLLGCAHCLSQAADPFVIDPAQSVITLSGTLAGVAAQPQGPGSLQSRLTGTLEVELTPDTIHFPGGSLMDVEETGEWEPAVGGGAGSAPADFGAMASLGFLGNGVAAARDIGLDAETAGPLALTAAEFDAADVLFRFPLGANATLDYRVTGILSDSGSAALGGYATNAVAGAGTLEQAGDLLTLTIPIQATYILTLLTPGDSALRIDGQIVARRQGGASGPVVAPPVIAGDTITISWSGGGELEVTTDLINWSGTGNTSGSFSEPVGTNDTRFYRVGPG